METLNKHIFQINNPKVKAIYDNNDNYNIKFHDGTGVQKNLCIVYFSSNDLYYPNTPKAFEKSILTKDKYEWQRNFLKNAHKHVFLRDVQKQWYIEGISAKHNSPETVLALLKQLTEGFDVYTVGSSAGGFAALLFGSMLQAKRVYAFNAQLNLNLILTNSQEDIDPLLFKYKNHRRSSFYLLEPYLNESVDYFYFQSSKSDMDIRQYNALPRKNKLTRIPFYTSNHGFPFLRHNLAYVMGLDRASLIHLSTKEYHPIVFAASIDGWPKTIRVVCQTIYNRFIKKINEKRAKS